MYRKDLRYKELYEENLQYKSFNLKSKTQNEDFREKILAFQENHIKQNEQIKNLEEKLNNSRYQISAIKNQIKEKEIEANSLKDELKSTDKFRQDKEKIEKLISNLVNSNNSLKEDLERKSRKIREIERNYLENKLPFDNYSSVNKSGSKNNHSENSLEKLRDKIIKSLGDENKKLKEKLRKVNYNNFKKIDNDIENNVDKSSLIIMGKIFIYFFFIFFIFFLRK
jgi:hypothetical protein